MKKVYKIIIIGVVIGLILASAGWFFYILGGWDCLVRPGQRIDTILIDEEADLLEYISSGTGSEVDPYVIENMEFGSEVEHLKHSYTLLSIHNIGKYLIIQNCTFVGGVAALTIYNYQNASIFIQNCSFTSIPVQSGCGWNRQGHESVRIAVSNSSNISILNNNFIGRSYTPIHVRESSNIEILRNTFEINKDQYSTWYGHCELYETEKLVFEENHNIILRYYGFEASISNNTLMGYELEGVDITFSYNRVLNAVENYVSTSNSSISNNTFEDCVEGLGIGFAENITIASNVFRNCSEWAIEIRYRGYNITIYHNSFFNNNIHSWSQGFDDGEDNFWYNPFLLEGNYWSDIGSNSTYSIEGSAGSYDLYPLLNPLT